MARIFIDGFESGTAKLWEGGGGGPQILAGPGSFTGNYYCHLPESQGVTKYIPETTSTYIGFRTVPAIHTIVRFYSGLSPLILQGWVQIGVSADEIGIHNNQVGGGFDHVYGYTAGATGDTDHFQIYFENISDTEKNFKVKLNDIEVIDYNLTNGTPDRDKTTTVGMFAGSGVGTYNAYIDDVVIDDADWPGMSRIYGMAPSANGDTNEWVASSGENYQAVDEEPPTQTDWVSSATPEAIDLFESVSPLVGDEDVKSVQPQYYVDDGVYFQPCFLSGESHYGPPISGELDPHYVFQMWEDNPITSGEWSILDIDRIQTGMRLV